MKDIKPEDIYKAPIDLQLDAMRLIVRDEQEKQIIKAVQNIGIEISKEDLAAALNNDRRRYEEAWQKGYEAAIKGRFRGQILKDVASAYLKSHKAYELLKLIAEVIEKEG